MSDLSLDLTPELSLRSKVANYLDLKAQKAELEIEMQAAAANIEAALHDQGVESIVVGDNKVAIVVCQGRASLDKGKLVELGVSTATIAAAEKVGAAYTRLDIRKAGKK